MIFEYDELQKRIKDNHSIFGSSDSVEIIIIHGLPKYGKEFPILHYTVDRDRYISNIKNYNYKNDYGVELIDWFNTISTNCLKRTKIDIIDQLKFINIHVRDEISDMYGKYDIITTVESRDSIPFKDIMECKFSVVIIFTKTKGLTNISIINKYITEADINNDPFLEEHMNDAVFRSIDSKVSITKERIEKLESYNMINQMSSDQKYNEYINNSYDESIKTNDNNDIIEYYNNDLDLKYTVKNEEDYFSRYLYLHNIQILGQQTIKLKDKSISTNLYNKEITVTEDGDSITSLYCEKDCDKLESLPESIEENIGKLLSYIGDYMPLSDPDDDTTEDDIIDLYKGKFTNIYIMQIQSKEIPLSAVLRILEDHIAYAYIMIGSKARMILIDLAADSVIIDSETSCSMSDGLYSIMTKFDNGKMKFNLKTTTDTEQIVSIFYSGIEGTVDIDYKNKKYNMFDSVLYSKSDKFMYIRNEYGVLTKISLL